MQLSSRPDPQHTSIGSRGSPSQAAFPTSPAPGATPGTLTKSMNDSNVDTSAVTERMDDDTASIGGRPGASQLGPTGHCAHASPGGPGSGWLTARHADP